ncbi:MAG TPA: hypothetical protein VFZ59_12010 [Verrucomicrobiae bacterium]|nr:hypothetical protein [Verrucomicrobiae bacterium]
MQAVLQEYGPPKATPDKYANVILNCEKCLKNSSLKNSKGVPVPVGTIKNQVDNCDDCLKKADKERTAAYNKK